MRAFLVNTDGKYSLSPWNNDENTKHLTVEVTEDFFNYTLNLEQQTAKAQKLMRKLEQERVNGSYEQETTKVSKTYCL